MQNFFVDVPRTFGKYFSDDDDLRKEVMISYN